MGKVTVDDASLFIGRGRQIALVAGAAVFSHYVLDLVMHPGDLALWPGSAVRLGLGLWRLPGTWWFVELALIGVACWYYWSRSRREESFGGRAGWVIAVVLVLHAMNAPWLSPAA